jgi:hypothetical protein
MHENKLVYFEFIKGKKRATEDLWKNFVFQLYLKDIPMKGDIVSFENMFGADDEIYTEYKILLKDFGSVLYKVCKRKMEVFNFIENKNSDLWTIVLKPIF